MRRAVVGVGHRDHAAAGRQRLGVDRHGVDRERLGHRAVVVLGVDHQRDDLGVVEAADGVVRGVAAGVGHRRLVDRRAAQRDERRRQRRAVRGERGVDQITVGVGGEGVELDLAVVGAGGLRHGQRDRGRRGDVLDRGEVAGVGGARAGLAEEQRPGVGHQDAVAPSGRQVDLALGGVTGEVDADALEVVERGRVRRGEGGEQRRHQDQPAAADDRIDAAGEQRRQCDEGQFGHGSEKGAGCWPGALSIVHRPPA